LRLPIPPSWSRHINRTAHRQPSSIQNMGVNHCGLDILMCQQLLHSPNVITVLKQVRGKTMAEGVATESFTRSCTHSISRKPLP
jgi:hypothetical protein